MISRFIGEDNFASDYDRQSHKEAEQAAQSSFCDIIQGGLCATFWYSFVANTLLPENHGGKQCIVLLAWGKVAALYFALGFIIFCIVNPMLIIQQMQFQTSSFLPYWIFLNLPHYIRLIMYVLGGIIVLGLSDALKQKENCGKLAKETKYFIWFAIVIVILVGFCYCCGCYALKEEDQTTTHQTLEQQNPISEEKPEDYGTMQNQQDNQEQEQEDQKSIIEAENQQQEEKQEQSLQQQQLQQQQEIDDPDKRGEKPKEEIQELQ